MDWKVVGSRRILEDEWISLRADACRTPEGTLIEPFYVLDYPEWVNVVALTDDEQVVLVRLYRHGVARTLLEIPGGALDPADSSPAEAAKRELLEETGFVTGSIVESGVVAPNPANQSNLAHCFLATGCRRVAQPVDSETEPVETVLVPLEEFVRMACEGELLQAIHTSSALFALRRLGRITA